MDSAGDSSVEPSADWRRLAALMTEKDLVGVAALGRHVESKRCEPDFVEIHDARKENWPPKWVCRGDRFKGSSKGTWDLRRINDVKFMV
jgi:hypothetical protein